MKSVVPKKKRQIWSFFVLQKEKEKENKNFFVHCYRPRAQKPHV